MTGSGREERVGPVTPGPGERGCEEQAYPDVLEFFHRGLGQGRQQRDAGGPARLVVFPRDQEQFVPDGDHDPQFPAVVSVDGIQVAAWEEKQVMLNTGWGPGSAQASIPENPGNEV